MKVAERALGIHAKGVELWFSNGQLNYRLSGTPQDEALLAELHQYRSDLINYYSSIPGLIGPYSASDAQTAMYAQSLMMPGHIGHVLRYPMRVRPDIDIPVLQIAITALAQRHRMLSTVFAAEGQCVQLFFSAEPHLELQNEQIHTNNSTWISAWIEQHSTTEINLEQGPLCQFYLAVNPVSSEAVLQIVLHHMVADHISLEVVWRDLDVLYAQKGQAGLASLTDINFSCLDLTAIAAWQKNCSAAEYQQEFWQDKLQSSTPMLKLDIELPYARQTCNGLEFHQAIDKPLSTDISELAEALDVTDFMLMFCAYQLLLLLHSAAGEVCVGVTTDGRYGHPSRNLVGCYVNTVPVFMQIGSLELSITEVIQKNATSIRQHLSNDLIPFADLVKLAPINRQPHRPLLFQALFTWLSTSKKNQISDVNLEGGLQRCIYDPEPNHISQVGVTHDVVLAIHDRPDGRFCRWAFDVGVYQEADVRSLTKSYEALLQALVIAPDIPINQLLQETQADEKLIRERFVM